MYEKSKQKFDLKLFKNPTNEYRGAPFWAWNDKLESEELCRQIDVFTKMGFGGFNMHPRQGLITPYLSDDYINAIKTCVKKANETNTFAWLYDEDRFPSGFAGGIVTKNAEFRIKKLVFSTEKNQRVFLNNAFSNYVILGYENTPNEVVNSEVGYKDGETYLFAIYDVVTNKDGIMTEYRPLTISEQAKGLKVYAYVETLPCLEGWNNFNIADMMHEGAVDKFIECTYQKYYDEVGESFGKEIPAIFTDEPQVATKRSLSFANGKVDATFSWTTDFPLTFKQQKGYDIVSKLPELVWDSLTPSKCRYDYFDHQAEKLKTTYSDKIGKWCKNHGILFSGHYAQEDTLKSQSEWIGEAMRLYDAMDVPGMDLLANRNGYIASKQVVSSARQDGKNTVLSELYGVTGWDFDFRSHKYQGDWHSALGVTIRVPHLSWYSMKGIAKRDYPASISYQSSWCEEYKYLEDHFSRLNVVLSRGKADVKIAVIHPIESYWLNYGPNNTSGTKKLSLDTDFFNATSWLIESGVDFDYISESTLPKKLKKTSDGKLKVGEMEYQAVVVLPVDTLRKTTIDALKDFARNGGTVIMSNIPACVDGELSNQAEKLYSLSNKIAFNKANLLGSIDKFRNVKIFKNNGLPTENYIMQRRVDDGREWVFIAHSDYIDGRNPEPPKSKRADNLRIIIDGQYDVKIYDTLSGEIYNANYGHENGKTIVYANIYQADSLLLELTSSASEVKTIKPTTPLKIKDAIIFTDGVKYKTNEPNVLVLDQAVWSKDGKVWNKKEEVLRINEILRKEHGYLAEKEGISQPYTEPDRGADLYPRLKFVFESQIKTPVELAVEDASLVVFNGKKISLNFNGYYCDHKIKKVKLGVLKKGENTVEVSMPFGKYISLENLFILGDFGVEVKGATAKIIEKPTKLHFSSITRQGFPFYGGKITYSLPFTLEEDQKINVINEKYYCTTVNARLDGKDIGKIIFSPYSINNVEVKKGNHLLEIDAYMSRVNSFGTLHGCSFIEYQGPDAWATTGFDWSYEYVLKECGILKSPEIEVLEK